MLILDWDVHHGNGTQDIFAARARRAVHVGAPVPVLPGHRRARRRSAWARAAGLTVNCALPAGQGDADYGVVVPRSVPARRAQAFRPDLVLVSAGFDAHARDPLAEMRVTERGFAAMTQRDRASWPTRPAAGKLVLLLEGGYDLPALAGSVRASLEVLTGRRESFPARRRRGRTRSHGARRRRRTVL